MILHTMTLEATDSVAAIESFMKHYTFHIAALLKKNKTDVNHPEEYYYFGVFGPNANLYIHKDLRAKCSIDLNDEGTAFIFKGSNE